MNNINLPSGGGGASVVGGVVNTYNDLPIASAHINKLWYVLTGSGGLLALVGMYKYPKGLYVSDGVSWTISQIQVQISEDATCLVAIDNWAEFLAIQSSILINDIISYNGILYKNLTGAYTASDPSIDVINWGAVQVNNLQMSTSQPKPTYSEGLVFYDDTKKALSYYNDESDVTVNIGQELIIQVYNNTGATIPNGAAVYPTGTFNDMVTIGLANAHDKDKCRLVGIVTHDILDSSTGYVTKFGEVGGIDTTAFAVGNILYLANIDGQLTDVKPTGSSFITQIGAVKVTGVSGSIVVDINTTEFTVEASSVVGWSPSEGATISFDDTTRTLTITPTGIDFCFYQFGDKYSKLTDSIPIPNEEGLFAIYYNLGVLAYVKNPTSSQIASLIHNNPIVAYIYWNATNSKAEYFGNEMHGIGMSADTHLYAHFAFGARYLNGLKPTNLLVDQTGALNTHAQFGMSMGATADEDIRHVTNEILSTAGLLMYYLAGTEAAPTLRSATNAGFSVLTAGTGRLAYNSIVGGNWTQVEADDNTYVFAHIFADNENSINKRVFAIQGQAQYSGLTTARLEAQKEIKNLISTGLVPQERVALATIIFQTRNLYNNAVKARIVSLDADNNYVDWTDAAIGNPGSTIAVTSFSDADFEVYDDVDISKKLQLQLSGVTTATTRTLEVPNKSGRIVVDRVANVDLAPLADGANAIRLLKADGTTSVLSVNTATERIGLGIAAPVEKLHLVGSLRVDGTLDYVKMLCTTTLDGYPRASFALGNKTANFVNAAMRFFPDIASGVYRQTSMEINNGSDLTDVNTIRFFFSQGTTYSDIYSTNYNGTGSGLPIRIGTQSVASLALPAIFIGNTAAQLVGIGTMTPVEKLTVSSPNLNGQDISMVRVADLGVASALGSIRWKGGLNPAELSRITSSTDGTVSSSQISFFTAIGGVLTEKVRITSAGNVNINGNVTVNNAAVSANANISSTIRHLDPVNVFTNRTYGYRQFLSGDAEGQDLSFQYIQRTSETWTTIMQFIARGTVTDVAINSIVGIGTTTPNVSAALDVVSTTKAFIPPRMTEAQRDAIPSPAAGMVIYNTTTSLLNFHNGTVWGAV